MGAKAHRDQPGLFLAESDDPAGFAYRPEAISAQEERDCVRFFETLPFKPFEFHGHLGRRRVVWYGWRYDYGGRKLRESDPVPDALLPLRARAAAVADLSPKRLAQVLVTEYEPGAGIGWHRDKSTFGDVIAVSFLSSCRLRLRRRNASGWQRWSTEVAPRSAYVLRGPSRHDWEHSVPPVATLRYSVTFRTLAG